MKFDFVIGNPPYQEEKQGDSNTATPVYHNFMDAAYSISDKTMLITPARFLFNAGYTPKEWNKKMLNDEHLKVLSFEPNSASVFNGVDIKGGVAITYRDQQKNYGAIHVFTHYPEVNSILQKVLNDDFVSLNTIITTSFAYHYTKLLYEENPELIGRASKGHDYDIQSNAFSVYPEVFFDKRPNDKEDYIRILGRDDNNRCWKYIKRKYVSNVDNLNSYKAFYAKATGTGQFGEALPEAIIGGPGDGGTVTFISIGCFDSLEETENCVKYTKTRFARTLLSVLKVTQDNTPGKWAYVPIQQFAFDSDVDWSKHISKIDKQLYRKYNLSDDEIAFIESHVKEME